MTIDRFPFFAPVKVLILHQHFNTPDKGGAIRSYYLAKALVGRGIPTVVITAHNEKNYLRAQLEGIEVHYLPVAYDNKFGFTARIISFLKFVWKSVKLAGDLGDIKICYAISVPLTVGLAAIWNKKRYSIPFLFEVGDLWPDAPIQMGFVRNYFFRQLLYSLEKSVYRQAESIVALSPAILSAIEKKVPDKTLHLIPNMADCEYFHPEPKDSALEEKWGVQGKFVVSYIGAAGVANGLDYLLECANASRKANLKVHFFLCGEGALLYRLKESAARLSLQNLTFLGFQNRDVVRQLMNVTDSVFICYKYVPILETGSPNKFFDGLAAGKLILINFGGWIKKEIEENRCGVYIDPKEPSDFVKTISPFIADKDMLRECQNAARQLGVNKYSRVMLSEKFASLFSNKV